MGIPTSFYNFLIDLIHNQFHKSNSYEGKSKYMFVLNLRIGPLNPNYYNPSRINNSRSRQVNNYSPYLGNNFGLQGDYNYFGNYGNPFFGNNLGLASYLQSLPYNIISNIQALGQYLMLWAYNPFYGYGYPRYGFPNYANRQQLFGPGFDVYAPFARQRDAVGFYGYGNNDYVSRNFWSWATGTPHPTNFLRSQGIPHGNYYSPWYSDQYGLISMPSYIHPFQNNRRGYNRPSVIDKFASMMDGINMPLQTFSSGPSEIDQMMNIMDGAQLENSIYDMAINYVTIKIISNVPVSAQYNSNPASTVTSA